MRSSSAPVPGRPRQGSGERGLLLKQPGLGAAAVQVVYKDNPSYDLMLALQLGVRWAATWFAFGHPAP